MMGERRVAQDSLFCELCRLGIGLTCLKLLAEQSGWRFEFADGKRGRRPLLPDWKREAIAKVPLGHAEKIAFEFKGDPFAGLPPHFTSMDWPDAPMSVFHIHPFDRPMATLYLDATSAAISPWPAKRPCWPLPGKRWSACSARTS
jgi:hypothetical protein